MISLFGRIFLTAWAVVLLMLAITVFMASQFMMTESGPFGMEMPRKVAEHVAKDLRLHLARSRPVTESFFEDLDFSPLLNVYVVDPQTRELRGRPLPESVSAALVEETKRLLSPQVYVERRGLQGYAVVAEMSLLPDALSFVGFRLLIFLTMTLVASLVLARFIVRPVQRLQAASMRVAAGDLSVRVAHTIGSRSDEIAQLAHNFDVMTGRVETLINSQQRLLRDVSHELRSPLARLQALLSIARQNEDSVDPSPLARMEAELERLDELIGEILAYARLNAVREPARRSTDIIDLVQNIADDASLEGAADNKEVVFNGPESIILGIDSGMIQSAIENVIRNAIHFTAPNTQVNVDVRLEDACVHITVTDSGPGVPESDLDKLFEPFFQVGNARGTETGSGGVGLAIAERSVRLHGGSISASNCDAGGLTVVITLPRNAADLTPPGTDRATH